VFTYEIAQHLKKYFFPGGWSRFMKLTRNYVGAAGVTLEDLSETLDNHFSLPNIAANHRPGPVELTKKGELRIRNPKWPRLHELHRTVALNLPGAADLQPLATFLAMPGDESSLRHRIIEIEKSMARATVCAILGQPVPPLNIMLPHSLVVLVGEVGLKNGRETVKSLGKLIVPNNACVSNLETWVKLLSPYHKSSESVCTLKVEDKDLRFRRDLENKRDCDYLPPSRIVVHISAIQKPEDFQAIRDADNGDDEAMKRKWWDEERGVWRDEIEEVDEIDAMISDDYYPQDNKLVQRVQPIYNKRVYGSRKALCKYISLNGLSVQHLCNSMDEVHIQTPCAIADLLPTMKETLKPSAIPMEEVKGPLARAHMVTARLSWSTLDTVYDLKIVDRTPRLTQEERYPVLNR